MRYIDRIKTLPATNADNALLLGTAIHTGIEKGVEAAIQEYYDSFPIIDDLHINEVIKLEYQIPRVRALLPKGIHEMKVMTSDVIAFLDLLTPNGDGTFDLYDFKYSNNVQNYMDSGQLHEYKYFYEKMTGKKIRNMYFVFVPKVQIKQKKTENLREFRNRIQAELEKTEVNIVRIEYDPDKVIEFVLAMKRSLEEKNYDKNPSYLCDWCEYQDYCMEGIDYMLLPSSERRVIGENPKRKVWIFGPAFSGKTTMLDDAPSPLNLNTDGNIKFVTMPFMPIKDEVTVEGRITKRKFAWEVFKDTIAELEKKQNDFKTIIVDLLEDTREMCRIFKYDELSIQHESDSGYGKGWDIIKTEYLSTIRRLFNLDYENIIVLSHEDVSKDITKKNGQNITRISPNIQDAIANKVAGMVDIVARVVVEDDGSRTLNFKSNEVIFGGGRLKGIKATSIPLSWEALMKVYDEANSGLNASASSDTAGAGKVEQKSTRSRKTKDAPEKPLEGQIEASEVIAEVTGSEPSSTTTEASTSTETGTTDPAAEAVTPPTTTGRTRRQRT